MKIINFIVCDEVRIEDNGKHLLIGVYPHNITLSKFPAAITLSAWVQFLTGESTEANIEFRMLDHTNKVKVSGSGDIRVADKAVPATLPFPKLLVQFLEPGSLIFQIRETGKKWKTVKTMPVELSSG